jgi:hypothetical protein
MLILAADVARNSLPCATSYRYAWATSSESAGMGPIKQESRSGKFLFLAPAITRLRVIPGPQSNIRERANCSTVVDAGQHHHDQLLCDLGVRVGNACIVHIVVLELAVLVCLYGPPRFIVVAQFHDLVTNIASPRPHRRSLSSAMAFAPEMQLSREGGPKAALEDRLPGPLPLKRQGDKVPGAYSRISTTRRLRGSTITGWSFTIAYR